MRILSICVRASIWVVMADLPGLEHAGAQAPEGFPRKGSPPASWQMAVVEDTVAQYLMNPDGVVDGLLLESNVIVRFPPHLGQVLAAAVRPHDVVRVEGFLDLPGILHARSIVNLQNQRAVVDVPPPPKQPRLPPSPGHADRQPLTAHGTIRVLTRANHGEVDGAVLSDGTIIHFSPPAGAAFAGLLGEGRPLAATGYGTANGYGRSLEAAAVGPSPDQLQPMTAAPLPAGQPPPAPGLRP